MCGCVIVHVQIKINKKKALPSGLLVNRNQFPASPLPQNEEGLYKQSTPAQVFLMPLTIPPLSICKTQLKRNRDT